MSADRAVYLDSSAIVKLAVREAESDALRGFLDSRAPLISSALARTEVCRALLPWGRLAVERGLRVLRGIDLVRLNDRVLAAAGLLLPASLRSLDALHLATVEMLGDDVAVLCTYDRRMAIAAGEFDLPVVAPK